MAQLMHSAGLSARFKATIQSKLSQEGASGAVIAITRGDDDAPIVLSVGHAPGTPAALLQTDSRFYLYSVTKTVLAFLALSLVEEGRLSLTAPLDLQHLGVPEAPPVTLNQPLSHTAGLRDYGEAPSYNVALRDHPARPWTDAEFLAHGGPLGFEPGMGWTYSNIGYLVVRRLVEAAMEMPLKAIVAQRITHPLGLHLTYVADGLPNAGVLADGRDADGALPMAAYHPRWVAHGVMVSTAKETAVMLDGILSGRGLGERVAGRLASPAYALGRHPLLGTLSYGSGTFIGAGGPFGSVIGHTGEGPGYSVAVFHFKAIGGAPATLVALANQARHDLGLRLIQVVAEFLTMEASSVD